MKRKISIAIALIISTLPPLGQDIVNYDTLKSLCEGPIFIQCEKMPFLKIGIPAFEDTLKQYLKKEDALPKRGSITLSLAILRSGEVKYITVMEGQIKKLDLLIKAVKELSKWSPGIQNGFIVPALCFGVF